VRAVLAGARHERDRAVWGHVTKAYEPVGARRVGRDLQLCQRKAKDLGAIAVRIPKPRKDLEA
jgi:hypothetical protein